MEDPCFPERGDGSFIPNTIIAFDRSFLAHSSIVPKSVLGTPVDLVSSFGLEKKEIKKEKGNKQNFKIQVKMRERERERELIPILGSKEADSTSLSSQVCCRQTGKCMGSVKRLL